jgi:uncharacterized membrane-anchored protein YitT (DUF2179 family)
VKRLLSVVNLKHIALILLGAFLSAVAVNHFVIPCRLADGGLLGIAILVFQYYLGFNETTLSTLYFLLNIPLLFLSWRLLGRKITIYSTIGLFALSLMIAATSFVPKCDQTDLLLNTLFAGVLNGAGLGIILKIGGSTAGIDIIARVMNKIYGWRIGFNILLIDLIIILGSTSIIGMKKAMYTLIYIFVTTKTIDFVIEGFRLTKTAIIITSKPEELAQAVNIKLNRGVTVLKAKGAYTGESKEVLYITLSLRELTRLKRIILTLDQEAFLVVHNAHEVLGKGFSY